MLTENAFAETDTAAVDALVLNGGETLLPGDPFTVADPAQGSAIVDAIMGSTPGLTIDANSIVIVGGPSSVGYYDGSLSELGIGPGLLITSGTMPGTSNTVGWFGIDNGLAGDPALDAVINPIFATNSYDATSISFDFTVTDPSITGISFNIVFGTDEYPEWVDQFVDIAVILINGVNVAYFGNDPNAPLSVISQNLAAGYFIDNGAGLIPIEYDGVSNVLTVFAPVNLGVNTITIAIADTGDHIYDSGLFISNLQATTIPTTGVTEDVPCTEGDDDIVGDDKSENFDGLGGDDHLDGAGGDDVMEGGAGSDILSGGAGDDVLEGGAGADTTNGGLGNDLHYVDNAADVVVEAAGEGTNDRVISNVSYVLAADAEIELIKTSAPSGGAAIDFTGNDFAQTLQGNGGANVLDGAGGADTLVGRNGDDVLIGGAGDDILTGGNGADEFRFEAGLFGADTVTDFAQGVDRIRLDGIAGVDDFTDLAVGVNGSGWAVVTLPDGSTITLVGSTDVQVDASDFLFGP